MEAFDAEERAIRCVGSRLRALGLRWAAAGMLPLPVLLATDPASSAPIACVYLGLASAWLSTEIHRPGAQGESGDARSAKTIAVCIACAANVACFVLLGMSVGVGTEFPFPIMAALSAVPALGLVPWLMRRTREPFAAIMVAAMIVLATKLAACIVARVVYGPRFVEQGYVAADWRSAKLMISVFWILSTSVSLGTLLSDHVGRRAIPRLADGGTA